MHTKENARQRSDVQYDRERFEESLDNDLQGLEELDFFEFIEKSYDSDNTEDSDNWNYIGDWARDIRETLNEPGDKGEQNDDNIEIVPVRIEVPHSQGK